MTARKKAMGTSNGEARQWMVKQKFLRKDVQETVADGLWELHGSGESWGRGRSPEEVLVSLISNDPTDPSSPHRNHLPG